MDFQHVSRKQILKLLKKNVTIRIKLLNFRSKSLRTPSNLFIINLALFDLTMALEIPMLIVNSFYQRMVGWELGCDIYAALGSVSGMGSAITNAAIAYDRYRFDFFKSGRSLQ